MDQNYEKLSDFYLNQITELIELKKKENKALKSMVDILIKNSDMKSDALNKHTIDNNKD